MSSAVPEGWKLNCLEDLVGKITSGGTPKVGAEDYYGGDIPFLKIRDLTVCSKIVVTSEETITEKAVSETSAKVFPTGTVVTTMYGTIGVTRFLGKPMATNQAIAAFLELRGIVPEFLLQVINHDAEKLSSFSSQTTQANISATVLKQHLVSTPPLPEQKKIASILTSLDEVIENTQKQIDKLQDLKKAMLNELLTNGIGHTEFKDSELGRIPKSWDVMTVGKSCDIKNTLRLPISREERKKIRGNYPYYGPTGILDYINEYRLEGEYTLIGEDGDHFIRFYEKPQSIHIKGKFNVNNHAHILEGNAVVSARWVFWFFLHRDIGPALTRQGAGRYKLNKESLQKLEIAVPPIGEQDEIDEKLKSFDDLLDSKNRNLAQTQSLKKSLMQDLLTGKVRVQVN